MPLLPSLSSTSSVCIGTSSTIAETQNNHIMSNHDNMQDPSSIPTPVKSNLTRTKSYNVGLTVEYNPEAYTSPESSAPNTSPPPQRRDTTKCFPKIALTWDEFSRSKSSIAKQSWSKAKGNDEDYIYGPGANDPYRNTMNNAKESEDACKRYAYFFDSNNAVEDRSEFSRDDFLRALDNDECINLSIEEFKRLLKSIDRPENDDGAEVITDKAEPGSTHPKCNTKKESKDAGKRNACSNSNNAVDVSSELSCNDLFTFTDDGDEYIDWGKEEKARFLESTNWPENDNHAKVVAGKVAPDTTRSKRNTKKKKTKATRPNRSNSRGPLREVAPEDVTPYIIVDNAKYRNLQQELKKTKDENDELKSKLILADENIAALRSAFSFLVADMSGPGRRSNEGR